MKQKLFMFVVVPLGMVGAVYGAAHLGSSARWLLPLILMSPIVGSVAIHGFSLPADYMKRWTKAHGIDVTEENRFVVERYLRRGRRIRTTGALAGYVGYTGYAVLINGVREGSVSWVTVTFAGYLLGAAAAEIWAFRPAQRGVRTASLMPRKISDYVPRYALIGIRALPVALVALAASWRFIPTRPELAHFPGRSDLFRPDPWGIAAWAAFAVVLWLIVETTARRIVRRPQPATSESLVRTDDAIRSTAMHGLMGAGLALMLGGLAHCVSEWSGFAGPDYLFKGFNAVGFLSWILSIAAWLRLGIDQPWIVRRSRSAEQVAA
jgi:hypothetical protein